MPEVKVSQSRQMAVPAERVYRCVSDFQNHHQRFLPPAFEDYQVNEGGQGAGAIVSFGIVNPRGKRSFRMKIAEPDPGRVLTETDENSSTVTTWTFDTTDAGCKVTIDSRWNGASGIAGFFERRFAPRFLARLYADELQRLEDYARSVSL